MVLVAVFCPFLTVISVGMLLCSNMKDKKKHVRENINLHPAHAQLLATSYNTNVTVTSKAQAAVRATLLNTLPDMTPPLENSDLMASTVNNHNSDTGVLQKDESYLGFQASNLTKRFLQLQQGNVPLSDAEFHYSTGPDNLNVTAVPTFSDTSNHISNAPANCPDLPVIPAASQHFTNLQQKTTAGHKYLPFRLSSHVGQQEVPQYGVAPDAHTNLQPDVVPTHQVTTLTVKQAAAGTSVSQVPATKKRNPSQLLQTTSSNTPVSIRNVRARVVNYASQKRSRPQTTSNSEPSTSSMNQDSHTPGHHNNLQPPVVSHDPAAAGRTAFQIQLTKKRNSSQLLQTSSSNTPASVHNVRPRVVNRASQKRSRPQAAPTNDPSTSAMNQGPLPPYEDIGDCHQVCRHCGPGFWLEERLKSTPINSRPEYHSCCGGGKIFMRPEPQPPDYIKTLHQDRHFMEHIRAYNQMFAMTSFGAKIEDSINTDGGPYGCRSTPNYSCKKSRCTKNNKPRCKEERHTAVDAIRRHEKTHNLKPDI